MWLLGCLAVLAAVSSKALGRAGWQWLLWPAALAISAIAASAASIEALLLAALPLPLAFVISRRGIPPERVIRALLLASAAEAAVVILQYCAADPFRLLGWVPEQFSNSRMRVYGTLGNPNFVAAWLCGTLPLYAGMLVGQRKRGLWAMLLAIHVGAIVATGSRVALIAVPAALVVFAAARVRAGSWLLAAAVPAAAAVLWLSPARPLGETVEGRLYIARVTSAHLKEVPPWGLGPGVFRLEFAHWQSGWLKEGGAEDPGRRFAGPLDHAHNDYLEFWVDHGPLGLAAFFCLCGSLIWSARRLVGQALGPALGLRRPLRPPFAGHGPAPLSTERSRQNGDNRRNPEMKGTLAWSAAAGAAALLIAALVDFPFHRPAEWALFWVLLAIPGGLSAGEIDAVQSVIPEQKRKSENTCPVQSEDSCTSQ